MISWCESLVWGCEEWCYNGPVRVDGSPTQPLMRLPWTKPIAAAPACKNRGCPSPACTHTRTSAEVHKNTHTDGRSIAYSLEGGVHKYISGITEWVILWALRSSVLCRTAGFSFYFENNQFESPFGPRWLMVASYYRLAQLSDGRSSSNCVTQVNSCTCGSVCRVRRYWLCF